MKTQIGIQLLLSSPLLSLPSFPLETFSKYIHSIYMKSTKVFKTGGSYAVRLPKAWVPKSGKVVLHRENNRIIITEPGANLHELALQFAAEGPIEYGRSPQPQAEPSKTV